jgi:two-component system NtrC family sensor kinase
MTKLLVIEDEQSARELLKISLESDGHTVFTAEDGSRGLDIFARENPSIVLTDIKMPGMDGIEVLRKLKEQSEEVEVIVFTGHGDMNLAIQALQLEASDFILKPIDDKRLTLAVRHAEEKIWFLNWLRGELRQPIEETKDYCDWVSPVN